MNKISIVLLLGVLFSTSSSLFSQKAYQIDVTVEGYKDTTAYLAYYYGKGQYYRDTTQIDSKGNMSFKGTDSLESGMYSIIVNNRKVLDFIADKQNITMSTDTNNVILSMKVKGSPETKIFYEYLAFLNEKQAIAKKVNEKKANGTEREKKDAVKVLEALDEEVRAFITNFHEKYKGTLTSNFIYALEYPQVPEPPKKEDGTVDSSFAFLYFKKHFFDNFDFSDERLLRTSTYNEKMVYYMDKLTVQSPDSIIKSADYLLEKASANDALFKYTLTQLTSKYERSENMGMDAVFVHLAKNYFMKDRAKNWFSEEQLEKLSERVKALDPLLIGKKAPNIVVKDTAQKEYLELYDIEANYTIVYIWSPECGHCKTATPKLKKLYDKFKSQGVEVFGVGNEYENEEWIKFINKHNLDWINGSDGPTFPSNFRSLYDVYSTPQTYLLDKDKKILSKKMSVESLEKILEYFIEKDKKEEANEQ